MTNEYAQLIEEEVCQLTEKERYYRVRQMIYEDKFKHIATRATGTLAPDAERNAEEADTDLSSLSISISIKTN